MTEIISPIPSRLKNVAVGGHVAGADQIIDDQLNKDQETINAEVQEALGDGGTVDEKIDDALEDVAFLENGDGSAVIPSFDPQSDSLWKGVQVLSSVEKTQVKQNLGLDTDIANIGASIIAETSRATAVENTLQNNITSSVNAEKTRAMAAEADRYTKSETYTKTEVNGLVDTPHQEYVTVDAYASLPATGSKDTIYRVSNYNGSISQVDASVYSEYAWDGSQYVFLCVKSQISEVFDISVYNNNATYADLAAALGVDGANIPQTLRRGGMSVKYVRSSDNKYVQYRLTTQGFSTKSYDWQNLDLAYSSIINNKYVIYDKCSYSQVGFIRPDDGAERSNSGYHKTPFISIPEGTTRIKVEGVNGNTAVAIFAMYDENKVYINGTSIAAQNQGADVVDIPSNAKYMRSSVDDIYLSNATKISIYYTVNSIMALEEYKKPINDNHDFNTLSGFDFDSFTISGKHFIGTVTRKNPTIKYDFSAKPYVTYRWHIKFYANSLHQNGVTLRLRNIGEGYNYPVSLGLNEFYGSYNYESAADLNTYLMFAPANAETGEEVIDCEMMDFSFIEDDYNYSLDDVKSMCGYGEILKPNKNSYYNRKWCAVGDSLTAQNTYIIPTRNALNIQTIVNMGVGGRTLAKKKNVDSMCDDSILATIPSDSYLITVMGGTNDWHQGFLIGDVESNDVTTYCGAMNHIIDYITEHFPTAKLVFMCPPLAMDTTTFPDTNGIKNGNNNTMLDFANACREVCNNRGIPCAEIGQKVGWTEKNITTFIKNDGAYLHPNQDGGNRIASVLIGALKSIEPITSVDY